ncbi:hypothetical protein GGS20DRAFT_494516 [Poronia punctata]|nr:hypothetical protein GGS20DRAFT_494516 [Poronia punctata]
MASAENPRVMAGVSNRTTGGNDAFTAQNNNYTFGDASGSSIPGDRTRDTKGYGQSGVLGGDDDIAQRRNDAYFVSSTPIDNTRYTDNYEQSGVSGGNDTFTQQSGYTSGDKFPSSTSNDKFRDTQTYGAQPRYTDSYEQSGVSGGNDTFTQQSDYTSGDKFPSSTSNDKFRDTQTYGALTGSTRDDITSKNTSTIPDRSEFNTNTLTCAEGSPSYTREGLDEQPRTEDKTENRTEKEGEHNSPYWGDIPFGAGVYNGVTGHGSNESTSQQTSLRDRYDTASNTGIYNGVTGHGSSESSRDQKSLRGQDDATSNIGVYHGVTGSGSKESTGQRLSSHNEDTLGRDAFNNTASDHRVFPLSGEQESSTSTGRHNDDDKYDTSKRGSHFKEELTTAGFAAAGAKAAMGHSNKDESYKTKDETDKYAREKHSQQASESKHHQSFLPVASQKNKYDDEETTMNKQDAFTSSEEKSLPYRPRDTSGTDASSANKREGGDHTQRNALLGGTAAGTALSGAAASRSHGDDGRNKRDESGSTPQYNTLSDGTPSGVSTSQKSDSHQQGSRGHNSTDSSSSGQYNVLSSGTPSGINMENYQHHHQEQKQQQQQQQQQQYDPTRNQEQSEGYNQARSTQAHQQRSAYDMKDAANEGQAIAEFEMKAQMAAMADMQKAKQEAQEKHGKNAKVNPDFAGGQGNEMSMGGEDGGRQEDITYLRS